MSPQRDDLLRELDRENRASNADGLFYLQAIAHRMGMNVTDLQCLTLLASTGPISAGELSEMMGLTTGAITGMVNRLEKAGYVRRENDPSDARRVVIQPRLEAIEKAGAGFLGSQYEVMAELVRDFDDREVETILAFMRKANAITRREISRLRFTPTEGDTALSAPLGDVSRGRLVLATGAYLLNLHTDAGMPDMYRAVYEGPQPRIQVSGWTVTVRHAMRTRLFDWQGHPSEITLNATIPWEIELRGGAAKGTADLRELELRSLIISGGLSEFDITLPAPSGAVPVRCSGGAAKVTFHRPPGVTAQVLVKNGASKLRLDNEHFDYLASKLPLRSEGFSGQPDRYEFEFDGGASEVSVQ